MTEIHTTTGYFSEVLKNDRFYDRAHFRELMAFLSSIGVTHAQWITKKTRRSALSTHHDFDLLSEYAAAAHANGLSCYAVFKPFGAAMGQLPHTFPRPEGVPWLDHDTGLVYSVDPFLVDNPDLRLRRRPGASDPGGPVGEIRVVMETDEQTAIDGEDLEIRVSDTTAGFEPYDGPVTVRESVAWRNYFYSGRQCRIIHLTGLDIPADRRFIRVDYTGDETDGAFTNELGRLVELDTQSGETVPSTPGLPSAAHRVARFDERVYQTTAYLDHPEVRTAVEATELDDICQFETIDTDATRVVTLDAVDGVEEEPGAPTRIGGAPVMRGKPEYLMGNLSPAYESVREHWLDVVEECIDAGVDGVNFRMQNHTRSHEHMEYGYNDAVCDRSADQTDHAAVAQRNGDAYTQFLREAASLLDDHGCDVGVHLSVEIFADDERPHGFRGNHGVMHIPRNFDWQWDRWIAEFADYVELRAFENVRPWRRERIVDDIGATIADADRPIPLVYQGGDGFDVHAAETEAERAGKLSALRAELEWVGDQQYIDAYNLYETRDFTRIDEDGSLVGSQDYADIVREALNTP